MKYFVLRGFFSSVDPEDNNVSIFRGEKTNRSGRIQDWLRFHEKLPTEGERLLIDIKGKAKLFAFVYDVYSTMILLEAKSQTEAYSIASPFRSFLISYLGKYPINDDLEFLLELEQKPWPQASADDIAEIYKQLWVNPTSKKEIVKALGTGHSLLNDQLEYVCRFVKRAQSHTQLANCLMHLERSHHIFGGSMSGSYYQFHHSRDRVRESAYALEKKYLEYRTEYDMAFLSAFRAIEALLGTSNLQNKDIPVKLSILDREFGTSFQTSKYRCFFEIFSDQKEEQEFEEILRRFLDVRNAVAAHGNPNPPFQLIEDQVLEIQNLTQQMLYEAVFPGSQDA